MHSRYILVKRWSIGIFTRFPKCFKHILFFFQQLTSDYIRLLNKIYLNRVILREENLTLKCCQSLEQKLCSVMHSCALVDFPLLHNFILRSMFTMLACQQKQQCSSSEQLSVWVSGAPPLANKVPPSLPLNKLLYCVQKSVAKKFFFVLFFILLYLLDSKSLCRCGSSTQ